MSVVLFTCGSPGQFREALREAGGVGRGFNWREGGNGASELQGFARPAWQISLALSRYLDWGAQGFDVGNHSTELSGERAPRRLRMSSDFRPERRRWTAPLGMFTMAQSQVSPNEGLDPTLLGGLDDPCKASPNAPRFDDLLNQRLLRGEVAVEATVCESSVPHQTCHTNTVQTLFAKARRGDFHDAAMGVFFMISSVAHNWSKISIALYT